MQAPTIITGPLHAHGVRSGEEYLAKQRHHLGELRQAYPAYTWREPWTAIARPQAFISGGRWVVMCGCGNAPSADVEWTLAACFECGAIYYAFDVPTDRLEIEALLLARPEMRTRNWRPPETVAFLAAENVEYLSVKLPTLD